MKVYIIFGILSFVALAAAVFFAVRAYIRKGREKRVLTSLHIFTLGVFIATVLLFIPVYYAGYEFGDSYPLFRPLLIAVHHAFRVFILDGEFDIIRNSVKGLSEWLHVAFSLHAGFLYVLAPILTFSNVLSLFKNIRNEFLFFWHRKRPFFIFSELNERSITLAESIANGSEDDETGENSANGQKNKKTDKKKKPVIVFTDVFERDEENDYELLLRAHDIKAILLKKDITRLNTKKKKSCIEFFLIGDDESENTEQAIKLTQLNKENTQRAIYLFSSKQSSGYILDSLDKGEHLLSAEIEKEIAEHAENVLFKDSLSGKDFEIENSFYLRRIDTIASLPISVLSDKSIIGPMRKALEENNTKRISIMIIGTGEYGRAFLKTALWLYQRLDYFVEISVLDKEDRNVIAGRLKKDCPDLVFDADVSAYGDSNYHIRLVPKIDVDSSKLGELFVSDNSREWVKRTQLAIVSLGDDDKNIETAVDLRKLFDRVKKIGNNNVCLEDSNELPLIYSIVYNEKKASNMTGASGQGIKNYKDKSYHIRFVGSLKEQYSYKVINDLKKDEETAIGYHLEWVGQISRLKAIYEAPRPDDTEAILEFRKKAHAYFAEESAKKAKKQGTEYSYCEEWGNESYYEKNSNGDTIISKTKVKKEILKYMNYEYFRNSSIAKAKYSKVYSLFCGEQEGANIKHEAQSCICMCPYCRSKKMSEHMRWNAYMRTIGYAGGQYRADRGQVHPDIVPWDKLPLFERYKD